MSRPRVFVRIKARWPEGQREAARALLRGDDDRERAWLSARWVRVDGDSATGLFAGGDLSLLDKVMMRSLSRDITLTWDVHALSGLNEACGAATPEELAVLDVLAREDSGERDCELHEEAMVRGLVGRSLARVARAARAIGAWLRR